MIQLQTKVKLGDNSGVRVAKCLQVYGKNYGTINDVILVTIKNVKMQGKIKRGDLFKAIVIRVKKKKIDLTVIVSCLKIILLFY